MNKQVILVSILGLSLIGCNISEESEQTPFHPLFSEDENYYSLLVVNEAAGRYDLGQEWQEKNDINNVKTIHGRSSLDDTNNSYKFLELERSPAFVLFDTDDIVFKTYNEKELIKFLKTHEPK
jgi:hypothetical protein